MTATQDIYDGDPVADITSPKCLPDLKTASFIEVMHYSRL